MTTQRPFWLFYKIKLTGCWLPINKRFVYKEEGKSFIKKIKAGLTDYNPNLSYKIDK